MQSTDKPKICPLLANCPDFATDKIKCIGDRCAWWSISLSGGSCALVALADQALERKENSTCL